APTGGGSTNPWCTTAPPGRGTSKPPGGVAAVSCRGPRPAAQPAGRRRGRARRGPGRQQVNGRRQHLHRLFKGARAVERGQVVVQDVLEPQELLAVVLQAGQRVGLGGDGVDDAGQSLLVLAAGALQREDVAVGLLLQRGQAALVGFQRFFQGLFQRARE